MKDDIERLAAAGVLTERQAEAFVLRSIEAVPRSAAAESMGVSVNTLDNYVRTARDKIEAAERTIEAIEEIRHEDLPSTCGNCGDALGGRYTVVDDDPMCLECGGVDPAEIP